MQAAHMMMRIGPWCLRVFLLFQRVLMSVQVTHVRLKVALLVTPSAVSAYVHV